MLISKFNPGGKISLCQSKNKKEKK